MKKIITLVAFVLTTIAFAQQNISEGVLTTKITPSSDNEQMNAQLAMMGDMVSTTYLKNDKTRTEMNSPMQGDVVTIIDASKKKMLMLMDNPMMGKKYMTKDIDNSKEDLKDVTVEKTSETKKFLGYDCVKYKVITKKNGAEVTMDVYATNKLKAVSDQTVVLGGKIEGCPLYMEMHMSQMGVNMDIKYEATSVKAEKVDDAKFDMTVPEGYSVAEMPGK